MKTHLKGTIEKLGVNSRDLHMLVNTEDESTVLVESLVDRLEGSCEYTTGTDLDCLGEYVGIATGEMDLLKFDKVPLFIADNIKMVLKRGSKYGRKR